MAPSWFPCSPARSWPSPWSWSASPSGGDRATRPPPLRALELAEGGKLDEALAVAPDLAVVIEADTEVLHGRVVDVMDAVRLAGVAKLAIAGSPREAKR